MLIEFSIVPVGKQSMRQDLAEALKIVDSCGLPYQVTPTSTIIEGEWQEVMKVVQMCHDRVREHNEHVITTLKIDDKSGAQNQIYRNVAAVEQAIGRPLQKQPPIEKAA